MKSQFELLVFNRGLLSPLALARIDLKRTAMSAEEMTNWMPRELGSMMLRPGLGYLNATRSNAAMVQIPFVFASDDTAMVEVSDSAFRVRVDDALITRPSVSTAVANGTFDTNLASWTDSDEAGAVSAWVTGGYMGLTGTDATAAIRDQQVTVSVTDTNVLHALRIVVSRGPVLLRIGSTSGGEEYFTETSLGAGTHSIAFTPAGNFWIRLSNTTRNIAYVDSVSVESSGTLELPSPWLEADLSLLRWDQSGDVLFVACTGYQQRRIERRSNGSWSITLYQPLDGPFRVENVTRTTLSPSATTGNITVTASRALFKATQVGALFSITSVGQQRTASVSSDNTFTSSIRVTGVGTSRAIAVGIGGTWVGTVNLQRSYDDAVWTDVGSPYAWTANTATGYTDGLDNQIVYYRVGIATGDYTSGTASLSIAIGTGSIVGVVRLTGYTDETSVSAEVITELGGTSASDIWAEGAWSDYRGWPSAVAFHEGRLWWAGKDRFYGSVTDAFESFDPAYVGDAGPIQRSIGSGPVDSINWLVSLNRLLAGTDGSVVSCRSSSLDEPLTPTNFKPKAPVSQGSAHIAAVKIDDKALFVQQCGFRLIEMSMNSEVGAIDYGSEDLTMLIPEAGKPGIVRMAVQRQPDTRVHCVRSDGKVAVLVFNKAENVICWVLVETSGEVEGVAVLPGTEEDSVYYVVKRTINGATVRYVEKWALESECVGTPVAKLADSHIAYAGSAATSIAGLDHLEGEEVVVWGWNTATPFTDADGNTVGIDLGVFTVSGGQITGLSRAVTNACIGLAYEAHFKSTKLAYNVEQGWSGLGARKVINSMAAVLSNTHAQGLRYGPDFDRLDSLPGVERYVEIDENKIWPSYDNDIFEFGGEWDTDSRVCLEAASPRPCTVLAAILGIVTSANG